MQKKDAVTELMEKELGKEAARKILKNLDKMIKRRTTTREIEKELSEEIGACIARQICVLSASKVRAGVLIAGRLSQVKGTARTINVRP